MNLLPTAENLNNQLASKLLTLLSACKIMVSFELHYVTFFIHFKKKKRLCDPNYFFTKRSTYLTPYRDLGTYYRISVIVSNINLGLVFGSLGTSYQNSMSVSLQIEARFFEVWIRVT